MKENNKNSLFEHTNVKEEEVNDTSLTSKLANKHLHAKIINTTSSSSSYYS